MCVQLCSLFFSSWDREEKLLSLFGGLHLHFDQVTVIMVNRFISSAVGKIHRLKKDMLREPYLTLSDITYFTLVFNGLKMGKVFKSNT